MLSKLLLRLCLVITVVYATQAYVHAGNSDGKTSNLIPNADFSDGLNKWKIRFPHPNEEKYAKNHQHIDVRDAPSSGGKCIHFTLSAEVAASEGVKALSKLVPVEKDTRYTFGAEVFSKGPSPIIFVEGYTEAPERQKAGSDQIPGYRRIYRAKITVPRQKCTDSWHKAKRTIKPPSRFQPTHIRLKLYAYNPDGEIFFRNVFLKKTED